MLEAQFQYGTGLDLAGVQGLVLPKRMQLVANYIAAVLQAMKPWLGALQLVCAGALTNGDVVGDVDRHRGVLQNCVCAMGEDMLVPAYGLRSRTVCHVELRV